MTFCTEGGRLINVYAHLPYFIALCLAKTEANPKTEGDIVWGANNEWDDAAHGVLKLHYVYVAYQHQHFQAGTVNADVNSLLHATNNNNTDKHKDTDSERKRESGRNEGEEEDEVSRGLRSAALNMQRKAAHRRHKSRAGKATHLCINNERTHACTLTHTHIQLYCR